jgi:hypothetical protein
VYITTDGPGVLMSIQESVLQHIIDDDLAELHLLLIFRMMRIRDRVEIEPVTTNSDCSLVLISMFVMMSVMFD